MAETRNQITDLPSVANSDLADDDRILVRDRSDTTDGAEGTDKQGSLQDLRNNTDQRIDTPADLRGVVGSDRSIASLIDGGEGGFFRYDETSTATDDGETVIKPDSINSADPGRWLAYLPRVADQSEHDSPSGVAKLPTLERMTAATDRAYSKSVGRGGAQVPTNADRVAQNLSALSALPTTNFDSDTTVNLLGYSSAGDGGSGLFRWDSSDLSTEVSSDPQSGVYVAPDSDATGASGAWVRQYSGALNVQWFGAIPGGIDRTSEIQGAIDYAETLTSSQLEAGTAVYFPPGEYLISSSLTVTVSNISLIGDSARSVEIYAADPSFDLIQIGSTSAVYGNTVSGLSIAATGNATGGALLELTDVIRGQVSDIELRGWHTGIQFIGSNLCAIDNVVASQGGRTSSTGSHCFFITGNATTGPCSGLRFSNIEVINGSGLSTPAYLSVFRVLGCDGMYVSNSHFYQGTRGIHCEPDDTSGKDTIASLQFSNCYFDATDMEHVLFEGTASSGYRSIHFSNCQFREALYGARFNTTTTVVDNVTFTGGSIRTMTNSGIQSVTAGLLKNIRVVGVDFDDNNTGASASHGDLDIQGDRWLVSACQFVNGDAAGFNVNINSGANGAIVTGCDFTESTAGTKVSNSGTGTRLSDLNGYVIRNDGIAQISNPATSVTVAHGLDVTPSIADIKISLTNDASGVTRAYITNVTATDFDIAVNASPTGNANFTWSVDSEW